MILKKTVKPYNRLRLGSEFAYVRKKGHKQVGRLMILVIAAAPDAGLKTGVVCGRKFSSRAVDRNRARRLVWESFRLLKTEIEPCHMVVIPRKAIAGCRQPQVQKEMEYLLRRAQKLRSPSC
ncbi:MAG: ribonuclease P protein component [Victivallales bacterium]|nr:ribonuclease P protein component [Victivallales bacterium]